MEDENKIVENERQPADQQRARKRQSGAVRGTKPS
jgi:hypothetical protein